MKGTGAKRNVCPGSCVSTGAKFPVAPVESAPMLRLIKFCRRDGNIIQPICDSMTGSELLVCYQQISVLGVINLRRSNYVDNKRRSMCR